LLLEKDRAMTSHVSRRQLFTGLTGLAATGLSAAAVTAAAAQNLKNATPAIAADFRNRYEIITGRVYQCDLHNRYFFLSPDAPSQMPVYVKLCRAHMEPETRWDGQYQTARRHAIKTFAKDGDVFSVYAAWRPDLFEAAPWRALKLLSRNGEKIPRDCPVWADVPPQFVLVTA
jgi:hypothetical protein